MQNFLKWIEYSSNHSPLFIVHGRKGVEWRGERKRNSHSKHEKRKTKI